MALIDRLFAPLFKRAEDSIDPFARQADFNRRTSFLAYVWFYVSQTKWAFVLMLCFGFLNAGVEALVFTYVGEIVDILTAFDPEPGRRMVRPCWKLPGRPSCGWCWSRWSVGF